MPDMLFFNQHIAAWGDFGFQHRVLSQTAHQHACAPVNESLCETFVQRVRQPVLYLTRDLLPMLWLTKPIRPVGDECPCPDLRQPRRQGVKVAIDAIKFLYMA